MKVEVSTTQYNNNKKRSKKMVGILNPHGTNPNMFDGSFMSFDICATEEIRAELGINVDSWEDRRYGTSPQAVTEPFPDLEVDIYEDKEASTVNSDYHSIMYAEGIAALEQDIEFPEDPADIWIQNRYAAEIAAYGPSYAEYAYIASEDLDGPCGAQKVGGHRTEQYLDWDAWDRRWDRKWSNSLRGKGAQRAPQWQQRAGGGRRGRKSIRTHPVESFDVPYILDVMTGQ